MLQAALGAPRPEVWGRDPAPHADGAVLVPGQGPVRLGPLVEQDCSDGSATSAEDLRGNRADRTVRGQERLEGLEACNADAGSLR